MASQKIRTEYIEGNVVRKYYDYTRPARKKERTIERRSDRKVSPRKHRNAAIGIDMPYLVMLILAAGAAMFILFSYIKVQSSISSCLKTIETQEKQLELLKSENDALQTSINTSVDLDYIYKVATEELGMVYAGKNQIIRYDKTESEYVRQYANIPD